MEPVAAGLKTELAEKLDCSSSRHHCRFHNSGLLGRQLVAQLLRAVCMMFVDVCGC